MDNFQDNEFSSDPTISVDYDNIEKVGKRMLGFSAVVVVLGSAWAIASPIISVLTLKKVNKLNNKINSSFQNLIVELKKEKTNG